MSALASIYMKKETVETILDTINKKGDKGFEITVSINDETNDYGQNVTSFASQTKEQREANKPKFYVGNGKVFWNNGTIKNAEKKEHNTTQAQQDDSGSLPF